MLLYADELIFLHSFFSYFQKGSKIQNRTTMLYILLFGGKKKNEAGEYQDKVEEKVKKLSQNMQSTKILCLMYNSAQQS